MATIIKLIYMWADEYPHDKVKKELGINKNTCVSWYLKLREWVEDSIVSEGQFLGGIDDDGVVRDVEIDESLFFKRKYNRGRIGNPLWVFGAIERNTGRCFFVPVENRSAETLLGIIYERILPGSRIISDQWSAYNSLGRSEIYDHATVNHSRNFVSPDDPQIHTQNIESLWCHVKRKLRSQFGTSEDLIEGYFFEFVWRKRVRISKRNTINEAFLMIANLFLE